MIHCVYTTLLILFIATIAAAKPTNPLKPNVPAAPIMSPSDLSIARIRAMEGPTNWGWLCANGREFTLEGHSAWRATGYVRADGLITIMWVMLSDESLAPGVYRIDDAKGLTGEWGYSHDARINDAGRLEGVLRLDKLMNILPPEPDI